MFDLGFEFFNPIKHLLNLITYPVLFCLVRIRNRIRFQSCVVDSFLICPTGKSLDNIFSVSGEISIIVFQVGSLWIFRRKHETKVTCNKFPVNVMNFSKGTSSTKYKNKCFAVMSIHRQHAIELGVMLKARFEPSFRNPSLAFTGLQCVLLCLSEICFSRHPGGCHRPHLPAESGQDSAAR